MKAHKHQVKAAGKIVNILARHDVAYLVGEPRSGKTLTIMTVIDEIREKGDKILVVTAKKAKKDIETQHRKARFDYSITVTNYESIHKIDFIPTKVILDEAHKIGKFPRPAKAAKFMRKKWKGRPLFVLMSGTPSPESFSQLFHQLWVTWTGPWSEYGNFYRWARDYVDIKKKFVGMGFAKNDYSQALPEVMKEFERISLSMTQKDAGFKGEVKDVIHILDIPIRIALMLSLLKKTEMLRHGKVKLISDTKSKMLQHFHQLCSGTCIDENGDRHVVDDFKVRYIKEAFKGKLAIFYMYVSEGEMLRKAFKNWTDDPDEYNASKKLVYICQVTRTKLGVNIATADDLVFFNMPFSSETYIQARARSITKEAGHKKVHFLLTDGGVEKDIYTKVTVNKKDFTTKHFYA